MAAAPELVDELVEEVLLRIPPDDPASLARAALASKRWCRVAAGRSFRERHRRAAPPVLGLLCNLSGPDRGRGRGGNARASGFVPTSSFRPPCAAAGPRCGWRVLDARHGRVLLANLAWEKGPAANALVLWDPVTGDRLELPELPRHMETLPWTSWNAAVLCAAGFPSTSWKATISFPSGMLSAGWNPLRWPPLQPHEPPVSSTSGGSNDSVCDHTDCRRPAVDPSSSLWWGSTRAARCSATSTHQRLAIGAGRPLVLRTLIWIAMPTAPLWGIQYTSSVR